MAQPQTTIAVAPGKLLDSALWLAVAVVAGWIAYAVISKALDWIERLVLGRVPSEANRRRLATFFVLVDSVLKGAIVFGAAMVIVRIMGISLGSASKLVVTLVVAWVIYVVLTRAIRVAAIGAEARIQRPDEAQRVKTMILLGESVVKYAVVIAAGLTMAAQLGFNLGPVLAGAGILGLAVGFGAQNLVRDVISGFFIILEGQYAVGDIVEINGVLGRVEEVGLRITRLRDMSGELRYFTNGSISAANNYTEDHVAYVVTVPVPKDDPADPIALVRGILDDFEREFRTRAEEPSLSVEDMPSYSRVVRVHMRAIPGRTALLEQKLPIRMAAGLVRAGHAMPEGTEIGLSLQYPPPGSGSG